MDRKDKKKILICFIFVFLFLLRLIGITNPPLDYSSWRQTDTDSIARNFVEYRFNIFYPQLNYDGPMPNYVQLEFQVTTFIIAILYKILGFHPAVGRMVPVIFFMGSCYYLYNLVKRKSGINAAIVAVLIYGLLPINIVYSRNIMPESALMFFMLGSINYFDMWMEDGKTRYYILAVLFTTLTVLTKVPGGFIGIPMIYLALRKYGLKAFKNIRLIIFPFIVFGTAYIYFAMLGKVAEQNFVRGIGTTLILPNFLSSIFQKDTINYLMQQFVFKIFTIPGIVLFLIGVLVRKKKEEYIYYYWLLAAFLHVVFIDAVIHLDYYLMFITPVISIFIALACMKIIHNKRLIFFLYISIIAIILNDAVMMRNAYKIQDIYVTIGNYISHYTTEGDLIVIDRPSPELFHTSGRKGWRLYDDLLTSDNLERLISQGAGYFIQSTELNSSFKEYLDNNFDKVSLPEGYSIYKLLR